MLETEIRPDELMAEQKQRFARDITWLRERRFRFGVVDCPVCKGIGKLEWSKHGFLYRRCLDCETVYMSPRPSPGLLEEYYQRSENYAYWNEAIFPASEEARRTIAKERAERIAGLVAGGTLIDVGAGFGTFAEEAAEFFNVTALEPEPHLAETCRQKGLDTCEDSAEEADFKDADVVTAFEVIEHLYSPGDFIARCRNWLAPGGLLVLTCPNVLGFEVEVLGQDASAVDPEHLNLMHPASLTRLLKSEGFEVIESETPGRLDCDLVGIRDEGLQDFIVASGRSSHMWQVARKP